MPAESTTSTNESTKNTDTQSLGLTGSTPTVRTIDQRTAGLNLVAAMVKRAVLDAHPQSAIPMELRARRDPTADWNRERNEAREWLKSLFKDKPSNMAWTMAMWDMPYTEASRLVIDKRFVGVGTASRDDARERMYKDYYLERAAAYGSEYISAEEVGEILGVYPATPRLWALHGKGPEFKRFDVGGRSVLGWRRDSVMDFAKTYLAMNPDKAREEIGRRNGKLARQNWRLLFGKGGHRGTNAGG